MSNNEQEETLKVAILGGGIAGLSCASQLLSQHKKSYSASSSSSPHSELEVTVFDTGRLRPGGRCSSRLSDDKPAVVQNRSPSKKNENRRACDDDNNSSTNNSNNEEVAVYVTPENIQKAITNNGDNIANYGPVDHAAQILSSNNNKFDSFQEQLENWLEEGVVETFPEGSVCELYGEKDGGGEQKKKNDDIKQQQVGAS